MTMEISSSAIIFKKSQILNKIMNINYCQDFLNQVDFQWMDQQEILQFMLIFKI